MRFTKGETTAVINRGYNTVISFTRIDKNSIPEIFDYNVVMFTLKVVKIQK